MGRRAEGCAGQSAVGCRVARFFHACSVGVIATISLVTVYVSLKWTIMNTIFKQLFLMAVLFGYARSEFRSRQGRQFFQQKVKYVNRESGRYQVCAVDGTTGACMTNTDCERERGRFVGYCGGTDDYCCVVDKTCGQATTSHQVYFRNPGYPNNDTEARTCNIEMEISRRVCAVRMTFHKFLLARYEDGVCIRDTLTILGTSINDPVTPVCGNMTSWITTFAVKERTRLTLAMVLQGIPAYTFSIGLTQLACDNIPPFQSPTYAGIRNAEAEKYIPTTTTTEAPTTTEDPTTVENPTTVEGPTTVDPTTATDTTEETTTVMNVVRGTSSEVTTSESVVTTTESVVTTTESVPTTLMPGKLPMPPNDEVLIRAALPELESEEEEGVYTGSIGTTPAISAFRRTFELLKVNEKCWQYYDEPPTFRVIGGFYANLNEYPWQVALVYKNKFFCGGSLISDRHILTASHCVFGSFSRGLDKLRVSLGDHDLATRNETKNIVSKVKTIHWHLHYNPHSTVNDIAVIELENPVDFSYSVSAVKLPTDLTERYEKANATITGWGRYTSKSKTTSTIMKEHTAPLVNTTLCVQAWNKFPGINASYINHVCLNVTMGTPCHGDSGGPLVVCTGVQCSQIGVVSFGFPLCTNVGLPAVFTRVTHYKSWIDMNLAPLNFV